MVHPSLLRGNYPTSSLYPRPASTPADTVRGSSERGRQREREKGRHPSSLRRGPSHPAARFARINTRHPNRSPSHPLFACAACLPACLPARLPKPAVQVSLENSNGLLPNPSTSRDAFQIVRHDYTTDCSTCHASWTPLSSNTRSIISRPTFSRGETRKKRDWGSVVAALFGGGGASSSVRRATSRWNLLEIRLEFSRENWKIVQRLNYNYNFNLIFIVI